MINHFSDFLTSSLLIGHSQIINGPGTNEIIEHHYVNVKYIKIIIGTRNSFTRNKFLVDERIIDETETETETERRKKRRN